ncbi:hypothetical protein ACHQM5_025643 [Ranunculus cassubicifolius]
MARTLNILLLLGAVFMVAMVGGATAMNICGINTDVASGCLPAIRSPTTAPTQACCECIRNADIPCLCKYTYLLRTLGIDPAIAMELPKKCNISPVPTCPLSKFPISYKTNMSTYTNFL